MIAVAAPGPASADEMAEVFNQLLSAPDDPVLNARYAELADARGETRKALAAYERALARDPQNPELLRAYRRVKRRLQPRITAVTWDSGITWASNPLQLSGRDPRRDDDDITFDTNLLLFDERTVARHRWRTLGLLSTQYQSDVDDLSDATVSFATGPLFDIGEHSRLHVAPGTALAWLDGDWLYHDALLKVTFETLYKGATQSVTAQVAHRDTNSKFLGSDGIIVDVTARLATYNKIRPGDALYMLPRFRYSEPSGGDPARIYSNSLLPGNYVEFGNRAVYYVPVAQSRVILGAGFGVYHRSYDQNVALGTEDREDWLLEPTAHLIIPKVRGTKFDFRIDYRYEHNDSNDGYEDFENHVIGVRTVRRF